MPLMATGRRCETSRKRAPSMPVTGSWRRTRCPAPACLRVDGLRVAEDGLGLVGTYRLLARRDVAGIEAELTIMLVAQHAQDWAVDRLLVLDARHQAALRGAHEVAIMVRPPIDVFFRDLGSRTIGIAVPCGSITWPRLHMELPL
jgi:hypothetical protein